VCDASTGDLKVIPLAGHSGLVSSVAFLPEGQRIVSASADHTIRVWDVASRVAAGSSTGSTKSVKCVAQSPHGPCITSAAAVSVEENVRTEGIEMDDFMTKIPIGGDGWMCGGDGELLLWIPNIHRPYFQRADTLWIGGKDDTFLGLANFVHGADWATVYDHSRSR
jgi:WD40 repeat protein